MSEKTPLMTQYRGIKAKYQDSILLFRVGDFYETFYEDAVEVASLLNIALTTRDKNKANPIPLAGVPFHAAENYITRLLSSGRKVAVCEQVEKPGETKGIVRREVVEVLTPGTALNAQLLADEENNYCLCLALDNDSSGRAGVAVIDVSTGDFFCGEDDIGAVQHLIQGKAIREMVHASGIDGKIVAALREELGNPYVNELDDATFAPTATEAALRRQFNSSWTEMSEELGALESAAAGALLSHCFSLNGTVMPQVVELKRLSATPFLALDEETIANLELFEPLRGGLREATLIRTIDRTHTALGAREIRRWMQKPLCDANLIDERLDAVSALYGGSELMEETVRALKGIADVQRLAARICARKAIPREMHALRESLEKIPELRRCIAATESSFLSGLAGRLGKHENLCATVEGAIVAEPPGHLRDGGVIRMGFDDELDGLIDASEKAKQWIAALEKRERESSGISTLKVGYNRVFGYFIEVSKANEDLVPGHYVQKQTLVSAQRYYTQELKEKEELILKTEEKRVELEQRAYERLCAMIAAVSDEIQQTAFAVGQIDAIQSLAAAARLYGYRRPLVDDSMVLEIVQGRHPVLERFTDEAYVPNSIDLEPSRRQFGLITGPNMSGKSTFMRQTALIVVLAQMGSFVPAEKARIGRVDQIFTRVGASDRLSRGESTFLVEMNETARILERISDRSLVILDEIGRGTSTYDGLSIAWAVTEYLLQGIKARPRTLFATHFHELTQLRSSYPRLVNLKITIKEWEGGIIFLRKIVAGTSDKSFGIHAARVAGMPAPILKRAREILESLEMRRSLLAQGVDFTSDRDQFSLFGPRPAPDRGAQEKDLADPLREALDSFDIDNSTPLEALQFLKGLKDRRS